MLSGGLQSSTSSRQHLLARPQSMRSGAVDANFNLATLVSAREGSRDLLLVEAQLRF